MLGNDRDQCYGRFCKKALPDRGKRIPVHYAVLMAVRYTLDELVHEALQLQHVVLSRISCHGMLSLHEQ